MLDVIYLLTTVALFALVGLIPAGIATRGHAAPPTPEPAREGAPE